MKNIILVKMRLKMFVNIYVVLFIANPSKSIKVFSWCQAKS